MTSKLGDAFEWTVGVGLAVGVLSFVFVPLYKLLAADGKTEFCYIQSDRWLATEGEERYALRGAIAWREDSVIATNLKSFEEAKHKADIIGCPIK